LKDVFVLISRREMLAFLFTILLCLHVKTYKKIYKANLFCVLTTALYDVLVLNTAASFLYMEHTIYSIKV
jgi:hypothetical protein